MHQKRTIIAYGAMIRAPTRGGGRRIHGTGAWILKRLDVHAKKLLQ